MKFPHNRYKRDELTDIRFQLRFRKLKGFALLNPFNCHDHIFQTLLTPDCDWSKQPIPGPVRQRSAIDRVRIAMKREGHGQRKFAGKLHGSSDRATVRYSRLFIRPGRDRTDHEYAKNNRTTD